MISFDQVLLLEQRVESAVAKISQLNAENAALRRKCVELTNALSAKTEQFSSFQSDQNKIEEGILKALERLNTVENAVLSASQNVQAPATPSPLPEQTLEETIEQNHEPEVSIETEEISVPVPEQQESGVLFQEQSQPFNPESISAPSEEEQPIQNNFDIF